MRSVSLEEFEEHTAELVAEVEAGNRLTLIRGGKAIAEVVPSVGSSEPIWRDEKERLKAIDGVMEKLRHGYDLGGFKITDRDALYDRDE
jgi:antitoxin (DNA-binding transcriptional repressor) of toxin-antitoxin stability system